MTVLALVRVVWVGMAGGASFVQLAREGRDLRGKLPPTGLR